MRLGLIAVDIIRNSIQINHKLGLIFFSGFVAAVRPKETFLISAQRELRSRWQMNSCVVRDLRVHVLMPTGIHLITLASTMGVRLFFVLFFGMEGFLGRLKGRISRLPEQSCWLYALIALQQHSPLHRKYYPTENWLSSRCLTSAIERELAFPS